MYLLEIEIFKASFMHKGFECEVQLHGDACLLSPHLARSRSFDQRVIGKFDKHESSSWQIEK